MRFFRSWGCGDGTRPDIPSVTPSARRERVAFPPDATTPALAPTQNAEPFGRVAIEALASGAALIATRRGGFVEIVGDAGILIDPPTATGIAAALEPLMADAGLRERLAGLGPGRVAGRYDLASAAAAFDAMVDALAPARRG